MDIDNVPVVGKINRTLNVMMINFILLAVVATILGLAILFFPKVLEVLAAAFLFVAALIFLNIAFHINSYKSKYMKYFD